MKTTKTILIVAALVFGGAANADTLGDVRGKGFVQCGVTQGLSGFFIPNNSGEWRDPDVCRAATVAIFGNAGQIAEKSDTESFFNNPQNERPRLFLGRILSY